MVDNNLGFRDDEERKEFYIALPVIALFGVMLYYFVFASDDKASLVSSATATAAFIDSDIDGIADHLDRCVNEKGTIENHGCLSARTTEEAPVVKSQSVSNKQALVSKTQPLAESTEPMNVETFQQVELIQPETTQAVPESTITASVEPVPNTADTDADGIADAEDECPDVAGTDNGCPADNDADGVPDDSDACPDQAGTDNGCPADNDGDGVPDDTDACPDQAGTENGCPADKDGDGVPDDTDTCPDQAGTESGCPASTANTATSEERVSESEEQLIVDAGINIQFDAGNAVLVGPSREILMEVALVMQRNPEIKLEAHGFTDSAGSAESNRDLSQQRAQACVDVIIEAGIEAKRLKAIGFGEAQPIATNDTAEGRQKNRRVEFKLIP